jgi:hypothetical protein
MTAALSKGKLLRESLPKKRFTFWRVVYVDEARNDVFLFRIPERGSSGTSLPIRRPYDVISAQLTGRFEVVEDHVKLPEMRLPEGEIPEKLKAVRGERYGYIKELVTTQEAKLYVKAQRGELLREHCERKDIDKDESTIRRLLVAYWTYGCNENAMIDLRSRRGGPGRSRDAGDAPRGRPNASMILYGEKGTPNRNLSPEDKQNIREALLVHFDEADKSYTATHGAMIEEKYPSGDGPKFTTFYTEARKITDEPGWRAAKAGQKEARERYDAARGRSRDLTSGPGDITDIDGTPFPQELIASWAPARAVRNPTLMLSMDRASHYITGFYDSLVPENWDAYRNCLFIAFTEKGELLAEYDLKPEDWRTGPLPAGVFFDRGPAISEAARIAICDELRIEAIWAPPNHPEGKPDIERMIRKLQQKMMYTPGSTTGSDRIREQERVRAAIDHAVWTPHKFRGELLEEIIQHNRFAHVPHLLTREMEKDEVKPTPEGIYFWEGLPLRGHREVRLSDEQLYFGLLKRIRVSIYADGVRFKGHAYSSTGLMIYRSSRITALGHKSDCWTNVYWDPLTPTRLYWRNPEGRMDVLLPDRYSADLLRQKNWADLELKRLKGIAEKEHGEEQRRAWKRARDKNKITRDQEAILLDRQQPPVGGPAKKVSRKNVGQARSVEHTLQQERMKRRIEPIVEKAVGPVREQPPSATQQSISISEEDAEEFLRRMMED